MGKIEETRNKLSQGPQSFDITREMGRGSEKVGLTEQKQERSGRKKHAYAKFP